MAEALEVTPAELDAFADRLGEVESYLHLDEKRTRVFELEAKSVAPGFWDDADAARATMEEIARTKEDIAAVDTARGELSDARAALELAEEMGDDPDAAALREEAAATAERLARAIDELELSSWFTGEFDHGDAIVTIKPGQGGLEAQDWTFMLFKMYMKYCQRRGWKVTINDCPAAEVIGIDRATFTVEGKDAFGMLRAEARLYEIELEKRAEALDEIRGPKTTIGFGNQIRSYVLYPYQMVKDLRTGVETSNVEAVLDDGDLDPFVIGYHRWATGNADAEGSEV